MKAQSLTERAKELIQLRDENTRAALFDTLKKQAATEAKFLRIFEEKFAELLPLLQADNIEWSAHMQDKRFESAGMVIRFKRKLTKGNADNKPIELISQIDFTEDGRWCTKKSTYGHWGADKLVLFLAKTLNLIEP